MANSTNEDNWAARERLRRIEVLLWWRGWVRRPDLTEGFGISAAQASGDLQKYAELNPGAMIYQTSRKRYEGAETMVCVLHEPSFEEAVRSLLGVAVPVLTRDSSLRENPRVSLIALPQRACPVEVARKLMIALEEGRWVRVRYLSVNSGTDSWRKLKPGGFGSDGRRWHLRAWNEERQAWLDFNLGRMLAADWPGEVAGPLPPDEAWETFETVRLRINPELNDEQKAAIRTDYLLTGDELDLPVRSSMRRYLLNELFIEDGTGSLPRHFLLAD